jgi:hypothetical protein
MLIEGDLETGLLAMSLGVGYGASTVTHMSARGEVSPSGIFPKTVSRRIL